MIGYHVDYLVYCRDVSATQSGPEAERGRREHTMATMSSASRKNYAAERVRMPRAPRSAAFVTSILTFQRE